jgi:hypothetical protein
MAENRIKKFPPRKGGVAPDNGKSLPNPGEEPEKKTEPLPPPGGEAGPKRPGGDSKHRKHGRQVIDITEVTFLRFEATKLKEQMITMERSKLKAEERLVKVSQDLLELRAKNHDAESLKIYKSLGIEVGDKLLETDKGYKIVRDHAAIRDNEKKK